MTPWDDSMYGFHLDGGALRGRLVRLGAALDDLLGWQDQPPLVKTMLGEMAVLAAALAGGLKYDGVFTLQTSGDGPVSTLMADVTSTGDVRAVARVDRDRLDAVLRAAGRDPDDASLDGVGLRALLGRGHLAFTVDQGPGTERYQGITALVDGGLTDCVAHYFEQSEQLPTVLRTAALRTPGADQGARDGDGEGGWRAGCVLVQRMPADAGGRDDAKALDAWETAGVLLGTLGAGELLDPALSVDRIVHRLFHGERLVPGETRPLRFGCRCSREKVEAVLSQFSPSDAAGMLQDDGLARVTCQFCGAHYTFSIQDLDALTGQGDPGRSGDGDASGPA
ncbi:Hsp33 family molecular chaperone HslO [Roseospira visakhapatnamensis]|uniref:Molecular chaperone Hsp33 n=1 Tax=Roseospira visakhapatnamensis TaxID=390880 RepID=A0A7W6RE39_9PROT|nr:Hsp33 family molecular chaperone HslO [Roseospira visakhapatnamensis]MBB4266655.1 molecular chaperone Hsp33 [Roseospira visakhapatnamensis]